MIRVNLAKTHNYVGGTTQTMATSIADLSALDGIGTQFGGKIVALVLPLILIYAYESYGLSSKRARLQAAQAQAKKLDAEIKKYGSVTKVIDDLSKEKVELDKKLKVIEKISKKRAFKLQTIIAVQGSLPEDLWLTDLTIDENIIQFKGYARSSSSVQLIVDNLNKTDSVESAFNRELKREKVKGESLQTFDIEVKVKP